MRPQRRLGILQPLVGQTTWQAICRYRSMVANDYFLRSRTQSSRRAVYQVNSYRNQIYTMERRCLSLTFAPFSPLFGCFSSRNQADFGARMLRLSDRNGCSSCALCATICGVSADLQASLQALAARSHIDIDCII